MAGLTKAPSASEKNLSPPCLVESPKQSEDGGSLPFSHPSSRNRWEFEAVTPLNGKIEQKVRRLLTQRGGVRADRGGFFGRIQYAKSLISISRKHAVAVLEGLFLTHVPDGEYTLAALPLRLVGFDASPVRAVLLPPRSAIV